MSGRRVGMVVDCSHSSHRTTMEAMELSADPVIFSHSNAWSLVPHGRNIRDDQIRACAATGGVVCVTGIGRFLGGSTASSTFVDHVAYMADLVGSRHVGISLDYAFEVSGIDDLLSAHPEYWPPSEYPPGSGGPHEFTPPSRLRAITATMLERGFSELEVRGVLGENILRVAGQVWKQAPVDPGRRPWRFGRHVASPTMPRPSLPCRRYSRIALLATRWCSPATGRCTGSSPPWGGTSTLEVAASMR